jgi:hypothetical protein
MYAVYHAPHPELDEPGPDGGLPPAGAVAEREAFGA